VKIYPVYVKKATGPSVGASLLIGPNYGADDEHRAVGTSATFDVLGVMVDFTLAANLSVADEAIDYTAVAAGLHIDLDVAPGYAIIEGTAIALTDLALDNTSVVGGQPSIADEALDYTAVNEGTSTALTNLALDGTTSEGTTQSGDLGTDYLTGTGGTHELFDLANDYSSGTGGAHELFDLATQWDQTAGDHQDMPDVALDRNTQTSANIPTFPAVKMILTRTGTGTITVPKGVGATLATILCWGAGGTGGAGNVNGGGGASGGGFAKTNALSVTDGQTLNFQVGSGTGAGATWVSNTGVVPTTTAQGAQGIRGVNGTQGAAGGQGAGGVHSTTGQVGDTKFNGGDGGGGGGVQTNGGGGGGGPGDNGNGGNGAANQTAGTAGAGSPNAGGVGGTGASATVAGTDGAVPGAGGGGGSATQSPGNGANGQIIITFTF
jgi:hypothetical protein